MTNACCPGSNEGANMWTGATDDAAHGYSVGSMWVNTDTDQAFVCVDATSTAAMWRYASGVSAPVKNNFAAIVAPVVGDDNTLGYSAGSAWVDTALGDAYTCVSAATGAASWKKTTP